MTAIHDAVGLIAMIAFAVAVYIDCPYPRPPTPYEKNFGNFACSVGFVCWTVLLLLR